tara:strand:+ start:3474 stop:3794 length:321 start_codon:yes stop_codon:yes gene_type:complete
MGKEVILNLDFLDELCGRPSPEEEFAMEKTILDIKQTKDIEKVKDYAIAFARQSHYQSHFIATCMERIALTEAKLISRKHRVKQRKTIFEKLSMINAILFDKEKNS